MSLGIALLTLLALQLAPARKSSIEGVVQRMGTNEPIEDAVVILAKAASEFEVSATTDSQGRFAFKDLDDVTPRPGVRAVGEERAWGRRLAKRFECDAGYDEQAFAVKSNGQKGFIDYESAKPEGIDRDLATMFKAAPKDCGALIVYGWTMAEDLVKLGART